MKNEALTWNILLAILASLGVVCKPLLSPIFNVLTDFIFIPGGSTLTGFTLSFLLIGASLTPTKCPATKMAFIQSVLALCMGVSGYQGAFVLVSYTIPGVVIDLLLQPKLRKRCGEQLALAIAGMCATMAGALCTNSAFFQLETIPFILFLSMGAISGLCGSQIAFYLVKRLRVVIHT